MYTHPTYGDQDALAILTFAPNKCLAMTFPYRAPGLSRSRKFGRYRKSLRAHCVFGTIQSAIAVLVLLSLGHPAWAFAANPDLETVLTGSRQRIENLDYRATGHLTRVEADGKRTSYKFVGKARWFPDGLRLLVEISGPGSEKTSLLLHMTATGHLTIEAMLPGEKAASVLPFEHWNDPLVGTDFTYEDMVESQFFWKNQQLLPPEKYGARDCFVLKSTPGPQDQDSRCFGNIVDRPQHFVPCACREDASRDGTAEGIYLLRAASGRRRLVCVASGGKGAGQARLLDSCNRRGLRKCKSWTQRL